MTHRYILRNDDIKARLIGIIQGLSTSSPWEVELKPYKGKRSLAQNRLMWKWIDEIRLHIADSTGQLWSSDDIHEWLKDQFLPAKVVEIDGKPAKARKSTAALNTREFTEYLEQIEMYCADRLGLLLTHPSVLYYEAMGIGGK